MNIELNRLFTHLALLQLRTLDAAERNDQEVIREVDSLVVIALNEIERAQMKHLAQMKEDAKC